MKDSDKEQLAGGNFFTRRGPVQPDEYMITDFPGPLDPVRLRVIIDIDADEDVSMWTSNDNRKRLVAVLNQAAGVVTDDLARNPNG